MERESGTGVWTWTNHEAVSYVGTEGLNLVTDKNYNVSNLNPMFLPFTQFENGPGSNYNALQTQYKRPVIHGLQALAGYTWSHALDSASADTAVLPIQRGNSSTDIRNIFTTALVYSVPSHYPNRLERQVLGHWDADLRLVARSGFPVEPTGPTITDPVSGDEYPGLLNYNGANPYVHALGIPGGRQFNPAVFSVATAAQNGASATPRVTFSVALERTRRTWPSSEPFPSTRGFTCSFARRPLMSSTIRALGL